jgi:hypothetical protein
VGRGLQHTAYIGLCSCSVGRKLPVRLQVVAQDQHVGSHLFAGCALLGQLVLGIIWAGLMVSAVTSPAPRLGDW